MTRSVYTHAVRVLVSLYFVEAAVLLILVGLYKAPVYDWTLLPTKAGITLMVGAIGLIASGWLLARRTAASGECRRRAFGLGLATNLLFVLVACVILEAIIRIAARRTDEGIVVGSVIVQPTWPELKYRSRQVLEGITNWGNRASFFIFDQELGWTVGTNRRSPDGMYFSSVEGLRSGGPNMRMSDQAPRFRVALIGDSNAFSLEVPFEESWGYQLQRALGDDVQVLNFGVDAYGVDQMYLRYLRDVRPWKPQVVLIGFGGHDFLRTMAVYPFVTFGWPGYLVKPRFSMEKGEPRLVNLPFPTPDEILNTDLIGQLPFVEYDPGYQTGNWSWRLDQSSLLLRFLTSVFPRWTATDPRVSLEATKTLNSRLLAKIGKAIEMAGATPLFVLMNTPEELGPDSTLSRARVSVLDMNPCVARVPADRRKVPSGHHYTGLGNLAVARCTAPAVELALEKYKNSAGGRARSPHGDNKLVPSGEGVQR